MRHTSTLLIVLSLLLLGAACAKKTTNTVTNTMPVNVNTAVVTTNTVRNTNTTIVANTAIIDANLNTSTVNTNTAVLPLAQRVSDASSTLSSPVIVPTADGLRYFMVGQPQGQNSKAIKKIIFSLPGHGSTAEQDYEAWRPSITDNDYAIASLNWWDGSGETTADYYSPAQVLSQITAYLTQQGYDSADFVVLEGFSRGSANTYAVKSYDMLAATNVIDAVISASGKYQSDFPLAPGALTRSNLYAGVPWILACGEKDDNPERDGCVGMNETKTWLTGEGASVLAVLYDPNGGHGAFHGSPLKLVDQALTLLNALPGAQ